MREDKIKTLSRRSFGIETSANSWEEIWEAGPYYDRVAELLENTQRYAIFTGWQIDSRLLLKKLENGDVWVFPGETLKEKLIRLCDQRPELQIYILMWDHAYFYVLERESLQGRVWEDIHPRVHFVFDNRHSLGSSHHEKISVFDGQVALCGGIDLCDERWDSPQHLYSDPRRSLNWRAEQHGPYHDLAVQVTGPVCAKMHDHIAKRWRMISSVPFPTSSHRSPGFLLESSGSHHVYLSRTIAQMNASRGESRITREVEFLFRDLIQLAQERIILEGQYYWSKNMNDMLMAKMAQMRGRKFEVYIILADLQSVQSLTKHMTYYELELIRNLQVMAEYFGTKLVIGSPFVCASGVRAKPIYIHSKILVIDDRYLGIGSANFSTRALRVDTELHITLAATTEQEREHIRQVGNQVLDHWRINKPNSSYLFPVQMREFRPYIDLFHLGKSRQFLGSLDLSGFFEPSVPWFYSFKHRIRRAAQKNVLLIFLFFICFWILGFGFVSSFCREFYLEAPLGAPIVCAIAASLWIFPVSFSATLFFSTLFFDVKFAIQAGVSGFWISSLFGYFFARIFPGPAARLFHGVMPERAKHRLGMRSFSELLLVLFDPGIGVRSKMIYQGLYCVPFPWFIFMSGLVLPSFIYITLNLLAFFVYHFVSSQFIEWIRSYELPIFFAILLIGLERVIVQLWKRKN